MEARAIVEALKKDKKALKELAEEIVSIEDIRLAIINAVLRDVATKSDLEKLQETTRKDFEKLREETKSSLEKLREETKRGIWKT